MIQEIGAFADYRLVVAGKCRNHGFGRFLAELFRAFLEAFVEKLTRVGLIAASSCALGDNRREVFEIEAGHGSALLSRVEPDREADFRHVLLGLANSELAEMKDRSCERGGSMAVANAFH